MFISGGVLDYLFPKNKGQSVCFEQPVFLFSPVFHLFFSPSPRYTIITGAPPVASFRQPLLPPAMPRLHRVVSRKAIVALRYALFDFRPRRPWTLLTDTS